MKSAPIVLSRAARAALLSALSSLPAAGLFAQSSTFNGSVSGAQWGTAANWSAGVPNAVNTTAVLASNGGVGNLAITNSGLGYTLASTPAVTFTAGTGAGGTVATAIVSNRVAIINVTNGGSGYTSAPTVTISGGGATVSAVGAATIDTATGKVNAISVQIAGYGYTSAPTVTISGGGGSGATAEAHLAAGVIGFNITSPGVYTVAPTVAIAAPTAGTPATATSTLTGGAVSGVSITAAGVGYVAPPAVTFAAAPAGGTRATGYAVIAGGALTSIVITHPGSGYTTAPAVTVGGPTAAAAATASLTPTPLVDNVGGSYPYTVGAINVTYGANGSMGRAETAGDRLTLAQSGGVQATATAALSGDAVGTVTITNGGSGYDFLPAVTVSGGGGRGAVLTPVLTNGVLTGLTVTAGGAGYTSEPTITIQTPDAPGVNVSNSAVQFFCYANLEGTQGLTKTGPGAMTFRFNGLDNTFSGPITIAGGTLGIQTDGNLGNADNDIFIAGGAKLLSQPSTNAAVTLGAGRSVVLTGGSAQIGNASPYGAPLTISTAITGPGGLTKTDAGPVLLTGDNTYEGVTAVNGGLLVVAKPSSLPGYRDVQDGLSNFSRLTGAGGTIAVRMGGEGEWTDTQFKDMLNNAGLFSGSSAIGVDTTNATSPVTIDGLLTPFVTAPAYGLAKVGPGTLVLAGENGYTGPTNIFEGTLRLSGSGRIPSATTLNFNGGGATLDLGGASQTIGTLNEFTGGGNTTITNGSLVIANNSLTISGNSGTFVDLSGLTSLTYTPASGEMKFEVANNVDSTVNTTQLAAGVNTFTLQGTNRFLVGGSGTSFGNGPHGHTVRLGATNTINAATFQIGAFNAGGTVNYQNAVSNGTLTLRASDGTSRLALTIGETSSGVRSGGGVLDLTRGSIDALAGNVLVNRHIANANNGATSSITLPAGLIDATTIVLGDKVGAGTPTLTTTVSQTGGVVQSPTIIVGRSVDGAVLPAGAAGSPNFQTTWTLAGGTLKAGSVQVGVGPFGTASVRTLGLAGGTLTHFDSATDLTLNGVTGNGGTLRVLASANTTSTIQVDTGRSALIGSNCSLVAPDATAVVAKTGAGALALNALSNSFNGTLRLDAGSLSLGGGTSIQTLNTGAFVWNSGAIAFDLSTTDTTSDQIVVAGALGKGVGSGPRTVDLKGVGSGTYTLATYASTDLVAGDLAAANVPAGLTATFNIGATSLTVTVGNAPVLSLIESWRQSKFGNSANTGAGADSADPDNDGRANLLEYATGTEPLTADSGSVVALGQSGGRLTLTFNRVADPSLTYTVRGSNDLTAAWSGAESVFSSTGASNTAGSVTATDSVLINAQARRFLRLEVTY